MITVLSKFNIKPDYLDMFKSAMLENQNEVRKEPGNLEMKLFQDVNNPSTIFIYGRTKDEDALEAHSEETEDRGIEDQVKNALANAPVTMFLEEQKPVPDHSKTPNKDDDDIILFFIFKTKAGYKEKLIAQFEKHIRETRKEPGNILFDFYTIDGEDTTFVVYEHWRSEDAVWNIHMSQPYSKETGALMQEAMIGEMEEYLHTVKQIEA